MRKSAGVMLLVIAALAVAAAFIRSRTNGDAAPAPRQLHGSSIDAEAERLQFHEQSQAGRVSSSEPASELEDHNAMLHPMAPTGEEPGDPCITLARSLAYRSEIVRALQAKDPDWSLAMEQQLRAAILSRRESSSLEVVETDCRTTFCEIQVRALVPAAHDALAAAVGAIQEKFADDFSRFEAGSAGGDDVALYRITLGRRRQATSVEQPALSSAEERELANCKARNEARAARTLAALESESKDAAWAYPMEQLLQQYLVARLRTHSMSSLDITCRTTHCTISARGRTEESRAAFQQAADEVQSEPWSDLRLQSGSSEPSAEGGWTAEVALSRQGH